MTIRRLFVGLAALALVLLGPAAGVASAAAPQAGGCATGELAPGTYSSITVTGFCMFDPGTIVIRGGLTVAPNAGVDATNCDLNLTITGGITVGDNAILGLGGAGDSGCAGPTNTQVTGGLNATNALAVIVHGTHVSGGVTINGGGVQDCTFSVPGLGFPTFVDYEDGSVNGGLTIENVTTCWGGVFRTTINGGLTDVNNHWDDPDANEIQTNTVHGPMVCMGNSPAVQQGDSEGLMNTATGPKIGECSAPGI
jgi:hypothetical protein